jgi:microcystin-dependent protein
MAKLDLPYQIINDSPASATPVQSDFTRLEQHINAELIERGGTVAMVAQLRLVGNPVNALDAAPKQYVDTILPIGGIMMFGGTVAPAGGIWLMCDGSPYQTADYPALFAVIGTRFGGSGGFFNVPPMVDRVAVGGGGKYAVGVQGGRADTALLLHSHTINHGHGDTYGADINHAHGVNAHSHGVGSVAVSANGAHQHTPSGGGNFVTNGTGGVSVGLDVGGGTGLQYDPLTNPQGSHGHTLSGFTDNASPGTGLMDRNNPHAHPTQVFNGASGQTGVAGAEQNMPPYVAMAYLIRAA